jgi:hypothetical protein
MTWGCVVCPKGGRVCGDNVTVADCPNVFRENEHCDDRYVWITRFKYTDEHNWTSFFLHKTKPRVCAFGPYRGWHEQCNGEGLDYPLV